MAILNGYTTLARLRSELGIPDSADDAKLERLITAVSRDIDEYLGGRRFYLPLDENGDPIEETRYYTARRCDRVIVDDCLALSELATDCEGDGVYETVWSTTDFDLGPANADLDGEPFWKIEATTYGSFSFPVGIRRGVRAKGRWAFSATAPANVEEACLFQCKLQIRPDSSSGVAGGGEFRTEAATIGLHPFTRRMLENYRRLSVG